MKPFRDQYGVWNYEDKPRHLPEDFAAEVAAKVARSGAVNGWSKGPDFICGEAADEAIDIPSWLKGLNEHPKPAGADDLIADIGFDAADLFRKIERLRALYSEGAG